VRQHPVGAAALLVSAGNFTAGIGLRENDVHAFHPLFRPSPAGRAAFRPTRPPVKQRVVVRPGASGMRTSNSPGATCWPHRWMRRLVVQRVNPTPDTRRRRERSARSYLQRIPGERHRPLPPSRRNAASERSPAPEARPAAVRRRTARRAHRNVGSGGRPQEHTVGRTLHHANRWVVVGEPFSGHRTSPRRPREVVQPSPDRRLRPGRF
jgi:hypothetical protein